MEDILTMKTTKSKKDKPVKYYENLITSSKEKSKHEQTEQPVK
jgi:hypothetical protein